MRKSKLIKKDSIQKAYFTEEKWSVTDLLNISRFVMKNMINWVKRIWGFNGGKYGDCKSTHC